VNVAGVGYAASAVNAGPANALNAEYGASAASTMNVTNVTVNAYAGWTDAH
jgi:hypothetical protein